MACFFFVFFTLFHLSLTFFRPEVPFKAKNNCLRALNRIQRYTTVDFQDWSKMAPKIKMAYISIFRSGFQKIL